MEKTCCGCSKLVTNNCDVCMPHPVEILTENCVESNRISPSGHVHVISNELKSLISKLNLVPTSIDTFDEEEVETNFLTNSVDCKY